MKFKILSLAIALTLTQTAFATTRPHKCPSLSAIKSVGFQTAVKEDGYWFLYNINQFDTKQNWLLFSGVSATMNNPFDALNEGNKNISSLSTVEGPERGPHKHWGCIYNGNEFMAIAITPPNLPQAFDTKSFLKK